MKLFNPESEMMIIGSILYRPALLAEIRAELGPGDFGDRRLRTIFSTMMAVAATGAPIDALILNNELEKAGLLDQAGGIQFIGEIVQAIGTTAGLSYHVNEVRSYRARRTLAELGAQILEALRDNVDISVIQSDIRKALMDIRGGEKAKVIPLKQALKDTLQAIESLCQAPGNVIGVRSGFTKIDRITGGWQPGELILIAGRPGMGKSVLAKDFAENSRVPVAYFSLEMSTGELVKRQLSGHSGVNFEAIRTGRMSGKDWDRLVSGADRLYETPVFYIDSASLTIEELERISHGLRASEDIGLVVVDYLQLLRGPARNEGREREVSDISRRLKVLARDLEVPVICLAQLNRQCEMRGKNKRPILSDLRESGSLEQDADIVAFVYRDAVYDEHASKNAGEFIIAKGRNIRIGTIKLFFDGGHQIFRNVQEGEEEPGR